MLILRGCMYNFITSSCFHYSDSYLFFLESLRRHSRDLEEQSSHFQGQLKEKEERETNHLQQLTATEVQQRNLQKRFDKIKQLQANNGQLNYLQEQLSEKEELKTKLESTERELKNCREQLLKKQDQSNYL